MDKFRKAVEARDADALVASLAEDVVFRSPVVFKPYQGREMVGHLLRAVLRIFTDFEYVSELGDGKGKTALEFKAKVGGRDIQGIDLGTVNEAGLVTELTVFVRPFSATQALMEAMRAELGLS
ncbi:hypothetical protein AKJ09_04419 [Labilithrix luteola]|uniref:SnoaL-like domain-containing protein n=1 Tax=Labilithrix luteola TaxID=1391654 RepID=A0A0K1PW60_9BACT|nr:nuclear transport factor 2 family protein [Labilithrix luteola]AKU97755.1 hypothetical protein AKJ09_04419 [Labilithrix luteola]